MFCFYMTQKGGNQVLIASISTTSNIYYLLVVATFKISLLGILKCTRYHY